MSGKVYVITKAGLMCAESYVAVKGSFKDAEKSIRAQYPNARKSEDAPGKWSYLCKSNGKEFLLFITEELL